MDPFVQAKKDVERQSGLVQVLHSNWKGLLTKVNTAVDEEFLWTTREINDNLKALKEDLADLDDAVQAMAQNPAHFKLTPKEVQARADFVKATRKTLEAIAADMGSTASKAKLDKDRREQLLESAKKAEKQRKGQEARDQKNQAFIDQHSPQVLVAKQDKEIEKLADTVGRLKAIAGGIGDALDEDSRLIDDLDYRVDNSLSKLKQANKKVDKLQKQI